MLKPALHPQHAEFLSSLADGKWSSAAQLQAANSTRKVEELVERLGLEGLKQVSHPQCVEYVCGST